MPKTNGQLNSQPCTRQSPRAPPRVAERSRELSRPSGCSEDGALLQRLHMLQQFILEELSEGNLLVAFYRSTEHLDALRQHDEVVLDTGGGSFSPVDRPGQVSASARSDAPSQGKRRTCCDLGLYKTLIYLIITHQRNRVYLGICIKIYYL